MPIPLSDLIRLPTSEDVCATMLADIDRLCSARDLDAAEAHAYPVREREHSPAADLLRRGAEPPIVRYERTEDPHTGEYLYRRI